MILKDDTKFYIVMRTIPGEIGRWGEVRTTDNGARDYLSGFSQIMSDKVQWSVTMIEGKEIFDRSIILTRQIAVYPVPSMTELLASGKPNTVTG